MLPDLLHVHAPSLLAVLDFETTGLDTPHVVEVALVGSDGRVLLETLVRPGVPIPTEATEVHGHRGR